LNYCAKQTLIIRHCVATIHKRKTHFINVLATTNQENKVSMSVFVTGGAGFIGSNFVLDWLDQCDEPVINLDALTYAGNLENLARLQGDARHTFVRGDIGDAGLVSSLLAEHKPRAVINFAAESHVDRSIHGPGEFIQTNIVGSFHLLESVRAYWNGLEGEAKAGFRFLHVSTDEVYGSLGAVSQ